jgi:predicted ribosomally synthesized peptide with SipW-like signal peptide
MKRRTLLVGALVIAVAVAAVVGGTYAIFTDTESMHVKFEAGTIDIEVNETEGFQEIWAAEFWDFDDFKPGDHWWYDLVIHNNGNNKAWIQVYLYPTGPWTEGAPDLRSCDPNPDCNLSTWGEVMEGGEWNRWVIAPSESITLRINALFPQCMGNNCQGGQADLLILVVAKQWRNKFEEDYACIALENKDTSTWLPILDDETEGIICFRTGGDNNRDLEIDLNAYGLAANACFQLDLTGLDSNNSLDPGCQTQDDALAGMPGDLYISGYWNWGTYLEATCQASNGGEGVWNYAGVYDGQQGQQKVCSDDSGAISFGGTFTGLPDGDYVLAAHVKEITDPWPGSAWTERLAEMDYLRFHIGP